ncbi:phosphoglucosamine mutase [Nitrosomonas sp. HPC101]|uniref:phosphoglucosamine mutase n=1 Tax=Nitrosomonas sp. HPC101 TaxID=1658667 RepID=UPI001369B3BA|nr:phosphoglucosamine mutase [Nitrosomonas sp. HPC101]MXS84557.1 phosphoglucosamine mutase [Nitrosomonas sp. HPC101]
MKKKYFGTDGIRGRVGEFPITPDFFLRLGYAVGKVLLTSDWQLTADKRPTILIGKDTRISGYMLESALEAGFSAAGVDVLLSGPLPTPAVAYLVRALRIQAGAVISASHNPFDDNGIKFFSSEGSKLPDSMELQIEAELELPIKTAPSAKLGRVHRLKDAEGRYIEFCKSTFPNQLDLRGWRIVVDCANGADYQVAGHVMHELGADVVTIHANPDGFNINYECGATHIKTLQSAVLQHSADFGIAVDGDGDRVLMVSKEGMVYDGDSLAYIIARHRQQRGVLQGGVVGTLMTNLAVEQAFGRLGIPFARANVGDRYVSELLQQNDWYLGAENSGHIICRDKHTTGDGIISALQVLCALRETGLTFSDWMRDVSFFPQRLINVKVSRDFDFQNDRIVAACKNEAEQVLGRDGRILLRASGTEPLIRVMVEGKEPQQIEYWAEKIAGTIQQQAAVSTVGH